MHPQGSHDEEATEERLKALRDSEVGRIFEPLGEPLTNGSANALGDLTVAAVDRVKVGAREVAEFQASSVSRLTTLSRDALSTAADIAGSAASRINAWDPTARAVSAAQRTAGEATGAMRRATSYLDGVPMPQLPGPFDFDASLLSSANPVRAFEAGLQFAGPALETVWSAIEPVVEVAGTVLEAVGDLATGIDLNL